MTTITIYSQPSCVQCNATFRSLDAKNLSYVVVDVTLDIDAHEFVVALGYRAAPVVVVRENGEVVDRWYGFNPDKLAKWAAELTALVAA